MTVSIPGEADAGAAFAPARTVVDAAPAFLWGTDAAGKITWLSAHWRRAAGVDPESLSGSPFATLAQPDDQLTVEAAFARGGPSLSFDFRTAAADGEPLTLRAAASRLDDGGYAGVCTEIMPSAGQDADAQLHAILDALPIKLVTTSGDGRLLHVNRATREFAGNQAGEGAVSWQDAGIIHPVDLPSLARATALGAPGGDDIEAELRLRRADGEYRWHLLSSAVIEALAGETERVTVAVDIDDRRRAEEELRDAEAWLRSLLDSLPSKVLLIDSNQLLFANRAALEYAGRSLDVLQDWRTLDVIHEEDRPSFITTTAAARESGDPIDVEVRLRRADGEYRWHNWQSRSILLPRLGAVRVAIMGDIDARKSAEGALARQQQTLLQSVEAMPEKVIVAIGDQVLFANATAREYTGKDFGEPRSWSALGLIPEDFLEEVLEGHRQSLATGRPFDTEVPVRSAGMEYRWHAWHTHFLISNGQDVGTTILYDIHDRKLAEDAVEAERQRFRDFADNLPVLAWQTAPDGTRAYRNRTLLEYTGAVIDSEDSNRIDPDDREPLNAAIRTAARKQQPWEAEFRLRRHDGEYRWHLGRSTPIRASDGTNMGWFGTATDIHQRIQLEAELHAERQRVRDFADNLPVLAWRLENNVIYRNRRLNDYLGGMPDSPPGRELGFIHPDDIDGFVALARAATISGQAWEAEFRLRRQDGEYRWHLGRSTPTLDEAGHVTGWFGTATDIHERREFEEALRASETRGRIMAGNVQAMVWRELPDSMEFLNDRWCEFTGLTEDDARGGGFLRAMHPQDRAAARSARKRAFREAQGYEYEYRLRSQTGEFRWFLVRVSPFRDASGAISEWIGTSVDIHDHKLVEQALERAVSERQEALALLDTLVMNAPVGVAFLDREMRFLRINPALADVNALSVEAHFGQRITDLLPQLPPSTLEAIQHVLDGGEPIVNLEISGFNSTRTEDQSSLASYYGVRDMEGNVIGAGAIVVDITERKRAEEALAIASQQREEALALLDTLVETAPVGIGFLDRDLCYLRVNSALAAMNGQPMEAHIGKGPEGLIPGIDAGLEERLQEVLRTGESLLNVETRGFSPLAPAGQHVWLESFYPVRTVGAADPVGVGVMVTDITERKRVDEVQAQLAAIVESSSDAILGMSLDGITLSWNSGAERLFGWTAEEAVGQHVSLTVPADLEAQYSMLFDRGARGERIPPVETVRVTKDGHRVEVLFTLSPVLDKDGRVSGVSATMRDIGASKRAERLLRESEARYRSLISSVPAKVSITSVSGEVEFVNRQWVEYAGQAAEQLLSGGLLGLFHPEEQDATQAWWDDATTSGEAVERKLRLRDAQGEYRWHLVRTVPVRDDGDATLFWISAAVDIDAIQRAEEALIAANEAKDEFLGLVSHELRTPLTQIYGNADILLRLYKRLTEDQVRESLHDIHEQSTRLQRMVENMLTLAVMQGKEDVAPEPVLVQRILPSVVESQRPRLGGREVELDIEPGLPAVVGEPGYLDQIVSNLLNNAVKYSPPGSALGVVARRAGDVVEVSVLDRGKGVSDEQMTRLFEPFFRAKETALIAPGLGLGLSVCRRFVEALGGEMFVRRREGGGMEFGFTLLPTLDE